MESSIAHRIQKLLIHLNTTPQQFCDQMKIQRSSLSHLLSGRNKPGFDFLEKLMQAFPKVNIEWLINDVGEALKNDEAAKIDSEVENSIVTDVKNGDSVFDSDDVPIYGKLVGKKSLVVEKKPVKVILFYEDHTFEVYFQ